MNFPAMPAIAAALFFLLPCAAAAGEEPEAVYAKYHQALRAGNFEEMKKYATAAARKKITGMPAGQRGLPPLEAAAPKAPEAPAPSSAWRRNRASTSR